jgi:uncharacterized membrane protein (UPF0127 family)
MKIDLFSCVIVAVFVFLVVLSADFKKDIVLINSNEEKFTIKAEVADSAKERARGLMNRSYLDEDEGMLFIFENEGKHGFWMKNTLIPLDLIFIDAEGKIVDIKHNFEPCSKIFCDTYKPVEPAKYVLEVNGGFCEMNEIKISNAVLLDGI